MLIELTYNRPTQAPTVGDCGGWVTTPAIGTGMAIEASDLTWFSIIMRTGKYEWSAS